MEPSGRARRTAIADGMQPPPLHGARVGSNGPLRTASRRIQSKAHALGMGLGVSKKPACAGVDAYAAGRVGLVPLARSERVGRGFLPMKSKTAPRDARPLHASIWGEDFS